jgi:integrase
VRLRAFAGLAHHGPSVAVDGRDRLRCTATARFSGRKPVPNAGPPWCFIFHWVSTIGVDMASLHVQKGGRPGWKVRYRDTDKRPKVIWLGAQTKKHATDMFRRIDSLVTNRLNGLAPDRVDLAWVRKIDRRLALRLAELGLVDQATVSETPMTVLAYMRAYIDSRTDWKKSCNHKQSVDHLETFLGRDLPLTAMTKGMADRFHRWMMGKGQNEPNLSPNTAGQHIKRARQMMRAAIDDRLIESNPFHGIKIDLRSDTTKNRFVDATMAAAILEACPDQEWRTLFALCRFGGLRCPSEALGLRWSDIQWDRGRFKVRSPKTEKAGKAERVVPLFPELLSEMNALYFLVQPGIECPADAFVIARYRDTETNLRTTLAKIADRAGVVRWPKPFMALRASRRTELERSGKHPNHVLNDWFGHTGAIAETHYLQVTEADFEKATECNTGRNIPSHSKPSLPIKIPKNSVFSGKSSIFRVRTIHPAGFEPATLGSEDRCAIQLCHGCVGQSLPEVAGMKRPCGCPFHPLAEIGWWTRLRLVLADSLE